MAILIICDGAESANSISKAVVIGQILVVQVAQSLGNLRSELGSLPIELKQVPIGVAGNVCHLL